MHKQAVNLGKEQGADQTKVYSRHSESLVCGPWRPCHLENVLKGPIPASRPQYNSQGVGPSDLLFNKPPVHFYLY